MSAQTIATIRGVIMCIALLFSNGVIPTNVDGGGRRVGDALMVIAVTLAAGDKNQKDDQPKVP